MRWIRGAGGAGLAVAMAVLPLAALGPLGPPPVRAATLRVAAASSLTEAFTGLAASFEAEHPGHVVEVGFGGSQILRAQIEQGAPVDVFASADTEQMAPLVAGHRVRTPVLFAHNDLVVVASTRSDAVHALADLARPGVRLVAAGPTVPVGRYTAEVLGRLDASGLGRKDFAAGVERNVLSRETNVRAVLMKVTLGEADAAFVYRTDIRGAKDVVLLEIPDSCNVVTAYPIAVVTGGEESLAAEFVAFVVGGRGQAILRSLGFRE